MAANFWETAVRRVEKKYRVVYKRGPSTVAMFFAGIAVASWLSVVLLSGFPLVQYIYYTVRPATSAQLAKVISEVKASPEEIAKVASTPTIPEDSNSPIDPSLPEGHYISIPAIGVDSVIWEAPTAMFEDALRKGVWRVPEMAEPDKGRPVILAAHRFGYLEWDNDYRKKNSFYKLPDLEAGDEFEILWDQRHYKYRVKRVTEGQEIDSYTNDVILYTCKFMVSPVRIFVYADRVN